MMTLIRGQKLPIFSDSGLSHNKLAVQIVRQAKIAEDNGQGFGIVFAAMGVNNDVADYFKAKFQEKFQEEKDSQAICIRTLLPCMNVLVLSKGHLALLRRSLF